MTNVTPSILSKMNTNLYQQQNHPLYILKTIIENYFAKPRRLIGSEDTFRFNVFEALPSITTPTRNFDDLCVSTDHPGRKPSDTYYLNNDYLLRTHTTAHEIELLERNESNGFIHFGECFRNDAIDATHYPVFNQMEAVRRFTIKEIEAIKAMPPIDTLRPINKTLGVQPGHDVHVMQYILTDLQNEIEGLFKVLFGPSLHFMWIPGEFPFTFPSLECEIIYRGAQLEVCGCGILQTSIMKKAGRDGEMAWAIGLGLERLAMVMFAIPDIRALWQDDPRFVKQFSGYQFSPDFLEAPYKFIKPFKVFSKFASLYEDVSFWISEGCTLDRDAFQALVSEQVGEFLEDVQLVDTFQHPKTKLVSHCYRITYNCMDRQLSLSEVNIMQERVRHALSQLPFVKLR